MSKTFVLNKKEQEIAENYLIYMFKGNVFNASNYSFGFDFRKDKEGNFWIKGYKNERYYSFDAIQELYGELNANR